MLRIGTIFAFALFLTTIAHAQAVTVSINITGLKKTKIADLHTFVVFNYDKKTQRNIKNINALNQDRDRGYFISSEEFDIPGLLKDDKMLFFGNLYDEEKKLIGYIPIKEILYKPGDRTININHFVTLDSERALSESYPFFPNRVSELSKENINGVLFSLQQLIDNNYVQSHDQWKRIYNIFHNSIDLFRGVETDTLDSIMQFARNTYQSHLNKNSDNFLKSGFTKFYLKFLAEFKNLNIDGSDISDAASLGEFLDEQIKFVFSSDPAQSMPSAEIVLSSYFSREQYETCIAQSEVIIKSLINYSDFRSHLYQENFFKSLTYSLNTTFDCIQYFYINKSNDEYANKNNRKGAVKFISNSQKFPRILDDMVNIITEMNDRSLLIDNSKIHNRLLGIRLDYIGN